MDEKTNRHEVVTLRMPPGLVADLRRLADQRRVGIASATRWLLSTALERELVSRGDVDVERQLVGAGR